jgi:hypothetical protein
MIAYCFAGVRFLVSGDAEMVDRVRDIFPAQFALPILPRDAIEFHLERRGAEYGLDIDGRLEADDLSGGEAVALVEHRIIRETALRTETHLVLHGAAVARERATLLLGAGGSGKSTLCCELVRRGWNYLSDELALVELTSGRVAPFHRAILLKPRSRIGVEGQRATTEDGRSYLHWDSLRPGSAGAETALDRIILCSYRSQANAVNAARLRPAEAVHDIAGLCFNYHRLGAARAWQTLAAVSQMPVIAMQFADAAAGAEACG